LPAIADSNTSMKKVISESLKKNLRMVVFHNTNEAGVKQSITRFEPINPDKPCYRATFSAPRFTR